MPRPPLPRVDVLIPVSTRDRTDLTDDATSCLVLLHLNANLELRMDVQIPSRAHQPQHANSWSYLVQKVFAQT